MFVKFFLRPIADSGHSIHSSIANYSQGPRRVALRRVASYGPQYFPIKKAPSADYDPPTYACRQASVPDAAERNGPFP